MTLLFRSRSGTLFYWISAHVPRSHSSNSPNHYHCRECYHICNSNDFQFWKSLQRSYPLHLVWGTPFSTAIIWMNPHHSRSLPEQPLLVPLSSHRHISSCWRSAHSPRSPDSSILLGPWCMGLTHICSSTCHRKGRHPLRIYFAHPGSRSIQALSAVWRQRLSSHIGGTRHNCPRWLLFPLLLLIGFKCFLCCGHRLRPHFPLSFCRCIHPHRKYSLWISSGSMNKRPQFF